MKRHKKNTAGFICIESTCRQVLKPKRRKRERETCWFMRSQIAKSCWLLPLSLKSLPGWWFTRRPAPPWGCKRYVCSPLLFLSISSHHIITRLWSDFLSPVFIFFGIYFLFPHHAAPDRKVSLFNFMHRSIFVVLFIFCLFACNHWIGKPF